MPVCLGASISQEVKYTNLFWVEIWRKMATIHINTCEYEQVELKWICTNEWNSTWNWKATTVGNLPPNNFDEKPPKLKFEAEISHKLIISIRCQYWEDAIAELIWFQGWMGHVGTCLGDLQILSNSELGVLELVAESLEWSWSVHCKFDGACSRLLNRTPKS